MKVYVIYEMDDAALFNGFGTRYYPTGEEFICEESEAQKYVDYLNKRIGKEGWYEYKEKEKIYFKNLNEAKINYLKRRIETNLKKLEEIELLNLFDLLPSAKEINEENVFFSFDDAEKIRNEWWRNLPAEEEIISVEIVSLNNKKIKLNMSREIFVAFRNLVEYGYYNGSNYGDINEKIKTLKHEIDEDMQELSLLVNENLGVMDENEQE